MLKLIFFAVFLLSLGCTERKEKFIEPRTQRCSSQAIENEYIVVFENGDFVLAQSEEILSHLDKSEKSVAWYEPNYKVLPQDELRVDPPIGNTYNVRNQWTSVGAEKYWNMGYQGQDIIVAVVDSGVDTASPFLAANWAYNMKEVDNGGYRDGIDNDENGFTDDFLGWNFLDGTNEQVDEVNHGTQIAHLIAGNSQSPGGSGVAPSSKILPIDFMDGTGGDEFTAIAGIDYAVSRRARIINNSWISPCSYLLKEKYGKWDAQGVLLINAAGNHGLDLNQHPEYSSNYVGPAFLSIGSIDNSQLRASFSNYGPSVLLYAPGTNIFVAKSYSHFPTTLLQVSGTSFSAAIVSGAAALIWSRYPQWTNQMVKDHLVVNSRKIVPSSIQLLNIND